MTSGKRERVRRTPAIAAIASLACIAAVLVFFALRTEPIPEAGRTPSLQITPEASEAVPTPVPSASPVAAPPPPAASGRFLDALDSATAARATAGSCTGPRPTLETTDDGGASWAAEILPASDDVRQILALDLVDGSQIDLVVLVGADCVPTVLTTFTAGEYWQQYPDRLATETYLDGTDPARIVVGGNTLSAPCATPLELSSSATGSAVRCADVTAVSTGAPNSWTAVTTVGLYALASSSDSPIVLGGVLGAGCDGLVITSFPLDGTDFDGTALGCAPVGSESSSVSLALGVGAVWIWNGTMTITSRDGGATWAAA
ncbi:hypothetical protein [Herbiconiux sp. YIM B11900]|uniref:hypothetical protein n=1 Tax=Herbiconiux sp. YIM B11900 TaxID=3404131 RepID=UPI003F8635ED